MTDARRGSIIIVKNLDDLEVVDREKPNFLADGTEYASENFL